MEIVKAGAQASKGFGSGSTIYVFAEGGMLLDLAIGAQKVSRIVGAGLYQTPWERSVGATRVGGNVVNLSA